ncbi:MAG: stage III sporulation protein AG [Angelakisella sp.]|jgi:stage III sporulation protein AG|nr:stage III sporulation protein AG [Angelakisella sp.]
MKEQLILKIGKYRLNLSTLVFFLGLAGILLIGLSSWLPAGGGGEKHTGVQEADAKAYSAQLEERLTAILQEIDGVGTARVMVTLENGYQKVYARSEKTNNDLLEDIRAGDEKKTQEKQTTEQTYVLVDGAGGKVPLVTAQLEPEIKGVVVVCEGGGDPQVAGKVVDTVRVALNISSARVSVSRLAAGGG